MYYLLLYKQYFLSRFILLIIIIINLNLFKFVVDRSDIRYLRSIGDRGLFDFFEYKIMQITLPPPPTPLFHS